MLIFPTIIIAMIFTCADIKAQSINISLANAYSIILYYFQKELEIEY